MMKAPSLRLAATTVWPSYCRYQGMLTSPLVWRRQDEPVALKAAAVEELAEPEPATSPPSTSQGIHKHVVTVIYLGNCRNKGHARRC